jgi:hypothetical protein
MSLATESRFRTYELREPDIISGSKLSELQSQCIQNNIAGYAHDIINVHYEDKQPHKAEYLRSYYRGAIEALEHLLHTDQEVREAISLAESTPQDSQFGE